MKNITLPAMKAAIMTPAVKSLVGTYLLARIYAEIMRADVDKVHDQILIEIEIHANTYGRTERLCKMKDLYMSDDDALCQKIYIEADKRLKAAGIKPADMERDYCPALVAENDLCEIEALIIKETGTPFDIENLYGEDRKTWLDLVVSAIIAAPDFVNPLKEMEKNKS